MPNLDKDYYLDKSGLQTLVNELEKNIVAEEFSSSATYNLGDYCIYGNLLYICTTPITTAGSWTGSTNWLQVLLADEVAEKAEIQTITLAQWETLTPEQKASGDYVISDATLSPLSASLMPYDNTTSGLTADDVQEAIDELAQGIESLNASDLPISSSDSTNTKGYIDGKVSTINTAISGKMDKIPTGEHTVYGIWSDTFYGSCRLWVAFPNADDYTISITGAKYRSADTVWTDITGATVIVKNDCGFLVNAPLTAPSIHYGEVRFTTA